MTISKKKLARLSIYLGEAGSVDALFINKALDLITTKYGKSKNEYVLECIKEGLVREGYLTKGNKQKVHIDNSDLVLLENCYQ